MNRIMLRRDSGEGIFIDMDRILYIKRLKDGSTALDTGCADLDYIIVKEPLQEVLRLEQEGRGFNTSKFNVGDDLSNSGPKPAILEDWGKLSTAEKEFVFRVESSNGYKHGAGPYSIDSTERCDPPNQEHFKSIALWEKTEELGFIKSVGSYKFVVTSKFDDLKRQLFLGNEK